MPFKILEDAGGVAAQVALFHQRAALTEARRTSGTL